VLRDASRPVQRQLHAGGNVQAASGAVVSREGAVFRYLAFSDGIGEVPLAFTITHARAAFDDTGPGVIFSRRFTLNFADPLQVIDGVLGVQVEFPEPGTYHCDIYAGEALLLTRRIIILQT
jgi:hypothetical protein